MFIHDILPTHSSGVTTSELNAYKLGAREIRKYSGGISSGKRSSNWQVTMEPWFKPAELQALGPGRATLSHPRNTGRPRIRRLPFTNYTANNAF